MDEPPVIIGPYRVVRQLGEGGMGAVFEAVHETIKRRVAIKVLHAEFARNPEFIARFFNEARAVNVVEHPGLVQISDYGQLHDGTAYIVMELLKGESLARRLRRAPGFLTPDEVILVGWQLADSLCAAHGKGIIHRDLKPDNVMLVPDPHMPTGERTKLLDFGIAKVDIVDPSGQPAMKTRANAVLGTPTYMSPEQCRGAQEIDERADVYSLGVMLYVMLSGQPPFTGEGVGEILGKHLFVEPPPLLSVAPTVPLPLAKLVDQLLSKDRTQRPLMQEVRAQLESMLAQTPVLGQRSMAAALAAPSNSADKESRPLRTTLGSAAVQTLPQAPQSRRRLLWVGTPLTVLGMMLSVGLKLHLGSRTLPVPAVVAARSRPSAQPKRVTLQIDSKPEAAVIRLADGQLLGQTPWQQQQVAQSAQLAVRLHRPGFVDREVVLDLSSDASRSEVLTALEPAPAPAPKVFKPAAPATHAEKRSSARGATPATLTRPPVHALPPIED